MTDTSSSRSAVSSPARWMRTVASASSESGSAPATSSATVQRVRSEVWGAGNVLVDEWRVRLFSVAEKRTPLRGRRDERPYLKQ